MRFKAGTNFDVAGEMGICCASRCYQASTIVVATKKLIPKDVHLCDRHWEEWCETGTAKPVEEVEDVEPAA